MFPLLISQSEFYVYRFLIYLYFFYKRQPYRLVNLSNSKKIIIIYNLKIISRIISRILAVIFKRNINRNNLSKLSFRLFSVTLTYWIYKDVFLYEYDILVSI